MTKFEGLKSLFIDEELHRELKMRAAETGKSIKELVEAACRQFLDGSRDIPLKEGRTRGADD